MVISVSIVRKGENESFPLFVCLYELLSLPLLYTKKLYTMNDSTKQLDTIMTDVKGGFSKIIRDKDINDMIGKEVIVEYGYGHICGVEYFKKISCGETQNYVGRYLIKVTNNFGKKILTSLFPDNELCFHIDEFEFKGK